MSSGPTNFSWSFLEDIMTFKEDEQFVFSVLHKAVKIKQRKLREFMSQDVSSLENNTLVAELITLAKLHSQLDRIQSIQEYYDVINFTYTSISVGSSNTIKAMLDNSVQKLFNLAENVDDSSLASDLYMSAIETTNVLLGNMLSTEVAREQCKGSELNAKYILPASKNNSYTTI